MKCNFNYWEHARQGLPKFSRNILQGERTLEHSQFDECLCLCPRLTDVLELSLSAEVMKRPGGRFGKD